MVWRMCQRKFTENPINLIGIWSILCFSIFRGCNQSNLSSYFNDAKISKMVLTVLFLDIFRICEVSLKKRLLSVRVFYRKSESVFFVKYIENILMLSLKSSRYNFEEFPLSFNASKSLKLTMSFSFRTATAGETSSGHLGFSEQVTVSQYNCIFIWASLP